MTREQTEPEPTASLPLPGQRWMPRRKAMVVIALRDGTVTIEEVCHRYHLLSEELDGWISAFERYGVPGLRATRVQIYDDLREASRRAPRRARQNKYPLSPRLVPLKSADRVVGPDH